MIYTGWDFRKSVLVGEEMGKQIGDMYSIIILERIENDEKKFKKINL